MAQERKTRKSARIKKQKEQPPISYAPSKRAHLAQKSLSNFVAPPLPTPSIEGILYCWPEPDFEAIYFSLYDKLAWECHKAEKTGYVDVAATKTKATAVLEAIQNTIQLTNNKHIRDLFTHLAQLISDYFIHPAKIKLKDVKRFLSKKTKLDKDKMEDDGYLNSVADEELLPPVSAFEALELNDKPPLDESFSVPSIEEILQWRTTLSTNGIYDMENKNLLPDKFPAELFPDAPELVLVNSCWTKIMATLQEAKTETVPTLKRPESPTSDETLSPTASHYELTRVRELGLRKKSRVDYQEDETPEMLRCKK
ncbi:MAG: hypothetical protein SFW07_07960 [Gammaproteobacteria bacterium]|nr:hypothetical protein [Gammaproteobacteria bacterium]